MASGRISVGSWTMEELRRIIFDWPSETPMLDPISEKVQNALTATLPFDLYPFALELISTPDGFISKRLALALIDFLVRDRQNWIVDHDKTLSLRRIRVRKFTNMVKDNTGVSSDNGMNEVAQIMAGVEGFSFWHLEKKEFSLVVTYLAQENKIAIFQALRALVSISQTGYDTAAALQSVLQWRVHIEKEFKPTQLQLL